MSEKYVKINSVEGGPFSTPSNRFINIRIPAGGVYDLSKSFVQLVLHLVAPDYTKIYNMCLRSQTENYIPMNLDLIRNCSLTGSLCGKMEDIRRVNVLKHNLNTMSMSSEEKLSLLDTLYQTTDLYSGKLYSLFVDFNKQGLQSSQYRDVSLRIKLSDLFSLGSQVIDTSKTGELTVYLELENLDYLKFSHVDLLPVYSPMTFNNIAVAGDLTKLTTTQLYENLETSPFFVGQNLNVKFSNNTTQSNQNITITSITQNQNCTLTLGISPSLPDNVAGNFTWRYIHATSILPVNSEYSLNVMTCELGLCELVGGKVSSNELEYFTWTTEEYSNGLKQLNKVFEVEENAVNAYLMFDSNSSNLISNNTDIDSYRMRVNNVDIYDRDIVVNKDNGIEYRIHDSLHYDSVIRTLLNSDIALKDLSFLALNV